MKIHSFLNKRKYIIISILILFSLLIIFSVMFSPSKNIYINSNNVLKNNENKILENNSTKNVMNYSEVYDKLTEIEKKQVKIGKRFTSDGGYKLLKLPKELKNKLIIFWNSNESKKIKENVDPRYIYLDKKTNKNVSNILELKTHNTELFNEINEYVKSKIIEWTNKKDIYHTITYGPREYENDSILKEHVDQNSTHILSAIINIKRDSDWPLIIFTNDDKHEEKVIEMNDDIDLVLYESATVIHGRPLNFKGNSYVNLFVHFTCNDWNL